MGLVVLLQRIEAEHERPLGAERAQPHVHAVHEAVGGRFAEHLHQLACELEEEAIVVDAAPAALGLSVLGEGEDEVDIGGEVQLARSELAERQDDELLGLAGLADRSPEVRALPPVQPSHARVHDRIGQIGGVAHGLVEVGLSPDVAPGDPHHLAAPQPSQVRHQPVDRVRCPRHRIRPLAQ